MDRSPLACGVSPTRLETHGSIVGLSSSKVKPPGQQPDGFNPKTLIRRARAWIKYGTGAYPVVERHTEPTTMARKRMLSPEMFTSRTVTGWPVPTRWTWAGLLCYLDNYGYGEDDAALVKSSVWPRDEYSAKKVAADLDRIAADGALCRFVCCGRDFMHAPRFDRHQKLSHKGDRRHCPCPKHEREIREGHARDSRSEPERFPLIEKNIEEEGGTAQKGAGHVAFLEMRNKIGHGA